MAKAPLLALATVLLLAACCSLPGCGGGHDQPPSEAANPAALTTPSAAPLAEATIGPQGGLLRAPGFRLWIPQGAFSTPQKLVLYGTDGPVVARQGCVSNSYRLVGLPQAYTRPLTISLQAKAGAPVRGFSFVGNSETVLPTSQSDRSWSSQPLAGTVDDGWIRAHLPATAPLGAGADEIGTVQETTPQVTRYSAFSNYRVLTSSAGHFRVIFHPLSCSAETADRLAQSAETAWFLILNQYGMSWARRTAWPVDLMVRVLTGDDAGNLAQCTPSRMGVNHYYLEVNSSYLQTEEAVRTIGPVLEHEVLHLAQALCDPRNRVSAALFASPWLWFEEATAVQFEYDRGVELVSAGQPLPIPDIISSENYTFALKHGLEYPTGERLERQRHGYGAAMFVQYILPFVGRDGLGRVFRRHYQEPGLGPCQVLQDELGGAAVLGGQFAAFMERWVEGTVFGQNRPRFPSGENVMQARRCRSYIAPNHPWGSFSAPIADLSFLTAVIGRNGAVPANAQVLVAITGIDPEYLSVIAHDVAKDETFTQLPAAVPVILHDFGTRNTVLLSLANIRCRVPHNTVAHVKVALQARPMVQNIAPASGPPGTHLVLTGFAFGESQGESKAVFDGAEVTVVSWSNSRIEVIAPTAVSYPRTKRLEVAVAGPATTYFAAHSVPTSDGKDFTLNKP